jgi:hypothetical protein
MDWIKNAIRGKAFPHQRFQSAFLRTSPATQLALIQAVTTSWVVYQQQYHTRNREENRELLHACHKAGGLFGTGALAYTVLFLIYANDEGQALFRLLIDTGLAKAGVAVGAFLLLCWLPALSTAKVASIIHQLVPSHDPHVLAWRSRREKVLDYVRNIAVHIPGGLALFAISLCGVSLLADLSWTPDGTNCAIVAMSAFFLGAGLSVAWGEKKLYSENAYKYGSMAELFGNGLVQLEGQLEKMRRALTSNEPDLACFYKERQKAQDVIFALGIEALNENAEWLILHRSRPTELVLPG